MPKVLVVDDEEQIRVVLSVFLRKMGFEVVTAAGGEEAVALLRSGQGIDLVVLDMKMPKVEGFDVLREKQLTLDETPVIVLTGTIDQQKHLPMLKELGVAQADVLTKPVDLMLLLDTLKSKLHMP